MLKKITGIILNILLCILPFSGVLMNFAPAKGVHSFAEFLTASIVFAMVVILLAFFIYKRNRERIPGPAIKAAAWLFVITGIIFTIPLSMDAPPPADIWLKTAGQEHFRFAMLMLACATWLLSVILTRHSFNKGARQIVWLLLVAAVTISFYDFYDLYMVDKKIAAWVAQGKSMDSFFMEYDFKEGLRAAGRICIYAASAWLVILLLKQSSLRKWVAITIAVFSLIGIVFCVLFVVAGVNFYFPFMVPAIALAPAFWTGIGLLNPPVKA